MNMENFIMRIFNFNYFRNQCSGTDDIIYRLNSIDDNTVSVVFKGHQDELYYLIFTMEGEELFVRNSNGESIFAYAEEYGWTKEDVNRMKFA